MTISISSIVELQLIGNDAGYPLDGDYVQTQDIDASDTSTWNGGLGFDPIGDGSAFLGNYDGAGFSITGLCINRPTENSIGLFGSLGGEDGIEKSTVTIKNINLINCNIIGKSNVGGISGAIFNIDSDVYVQDCVVTGSISDVDVFANGYVGGVVGAIYSYRDVFIERCSFGGTIIGYKWACGGISSSISLYADDFWSYGASTVNITDCSVSGSITGSGTFTDAAGIVSQINLLEPETTLNISRCHTNVVITSERAAGGLISSTYQGDINTTINIEECYSSGSVTGDALVGGFAGYIEVDDNASTKINITNCHSNASVVGDDYVGGFVGNLFTYDGGVINVTNCYSVGEVSANTNVGGFIGLSENDGDASGEINVTSCYWDTQTSGQATSDGGTGKTTAQMKAQATFSGWNFVTIWNIVEGISYPHFTTQIEIEEPVATLFVPVSEGKGYILGSKGLVNTGLTTIVVTDFLGAIDSDNEPLFQDGVES